MSSTQDTVGAGVAGDEALGYNTDSASCLEKTAHTKLAFQRCDGYVICLWLSGQHLPENLHEIPHRYPQGPRLGLRQTIPDVPGCFSGGETVEEAIGNAQEALALHFEALVADGDSLPQGSSIDNWLADPDYAGGVWEVVDFDITPYLST